MENPVGSLEKRPFMQLASRMQTVVRNIVMYCAYGYKYMKPLTSGQHSRIGSPKGTREMESAEVGMAKESAINKKRGRRSDTGRKLQAPTADYQQEERSSFGVYQSY